MTDPVEAAARAMRENWISPCGPPIRMFLWERLDEETREMWLGHAKAALAAADAARMEGAAQPPKAPARNAKDIVDQFGWPSNVMLRGKLVGQQYAVAELIAEAIDAERNCIFSQAARIEALEKALANERVAQVRGSNDASGFEACVNAEIESIRATLEGK